MSGSIAGVAAIYSPADVAAGSLQPRLQVSVNREQVDDTSLLLTSGDEVPAFNFPPTWHPVILLWCVVSPGRPVVLQLSSLPTDANLVILAL